MLCWLGDCRAVFRLLFAWVILNIVVAVVVVIIISKWGPVICSGTICVN